MKKLLLVDTTSELPIVITQVNTKTGYIEVLPHTELDPLTPEEINYFLTLHNHNEKGTIYAPIPEGAETKLRRMLP